MGAKPLKQPPPIGHATVITNTNYQTNNRTQQLTQSFAFSKHTSGGTQFDFCIQILW